ncbi:MAG: hypothetical protein IKN87_05750 [Bacilli bacterium]|nr:hypothetical protein [Bacilli bacterium]
MKNKTNDLWLNIYIFLLLPFCILINIWNLFKYIKHFNSLDNMFLTILQLILCIVSIAYYAYTFFYAKDRVKKAYLLIIISIFYSIFVASFDQTLATYYNQGFKTYLMFVVYIGLFVIWWGLPNYIYFQRRKDMFEMKRVMSKAELKSKISEAIKENNKSKNVDKTISTDKDNQKKNIK